MKVDQHFALPRIDRKTLFRLICFFCLHFTVWSYFSVVIVGIFVVSVSHKWMQFPSERFDRLNNNNKNKFNNACWRLDTRRWSHLYLRFLPCDWCFCMIDSVFQHFYENHFVFSIKQFLHLKNNSSIKCAFCGTNQFVISPHKSFNTIEREKEMYRKSIRDMYRFAIYRFLERIRYSLNVRDETAFSTFKKFRSLLRQLFRWWKQKRLTVVFWGILLNYVAFWVNRSKNKTAYTWVRVHGVHHQCRRQSEVEGNTQNRNWDRNREAIQ